METVRWIRILKEKIRKSNDMKTDFIMPRGNMPYFTRGWTCIQIAITEK